jgi:CYTH domain-containing protein
MASTVELEKTYLCSEIPEKYISGSPIRMVDIYLPESVAHPTLRLRQKGNHYEITKKTPIDNDPSRQKEDTIKLTKDEFEILAKASSRKIEKYRFPIIFEGHDGELDVFTGEHIGLLLVDFEFNDTESQDKFSTPNFCSADVTWENVIAGGILSGVNSEELFAQLQNKYRYVPISESLIDSFINT